MRNSSNFILQHCHGDKRKFKFTKRYISADWQEDAGNVKYPFTTICYLVLDHVTIMLNQSTTIYNGFIAVNLS